MKMIILTIFGCIFAMHSLVSVGEEVKVDGKSLYLGNCSSCHQITGAGLPPAFPALNGNKIVIAEDPAELISVLIKGRKGTAMLPFARLQDEELAAIITYTRTSWGNEASEVTAEQVKAIRDK